MSDIKLIESAARELDKLREGAKAATLHIDLRNTNNHNSANEYLRKLKENVCSAIETFHNTDFDVFCGVLHQSSENLAVCESLEHKKYNNAVPECAISLLCAFHEVVRHCTDKKILMIFETHHYEKWILEFNEWGRHTRTYPFTRKLYSPDARHFDKIDDLEKTHLIDNLE